jgi:murein DD-endopeptidase MepM/ murein hydrolase activator NlpD
VPEANTNWGDVRRLSELTTGDLYNALWVETYKPYAGAYDRTSAFQQLAAREKLGTPLTGLYQVEFEGARFNVQVFAVDTIYSPAADPHRLSALARPPTIEQSATTPPQGGTPADPRDPSRRPVFTILPLPTNSRPRIMQFYGYTHFSKDNAARLYAQTQGCHSGLDFSAAVGTPLLSLDHGVVFCAGAAGKDKPCPFGGAPPMVVIVQYGNVYAIYGHASAVHVQKGQVVRPGDVIGFSGEFPANTPHLHFEIRPVTNPATAFNPIEFFSPELRSSYYEPQLVQRGGLQHFCCGTLADQPVIQFGQPILTRPCEH